MPDNLRVEALMKSEQTVDIGGSEFAWTLFICSYILLFSFSFYSGMLY
jgi:hypothetical protein